MKNTKRQVTMTGCGWITPTVAGEVAEVLKSLMAAPSGAGTLPPSFVSDEILGSVFEEKAVPQPKWAADRTTLLVAAAVEIAIRSAKLPRKPEDPDCFGLALGASLAGQSGMIHFAEDVRAQSARFVSPIHFPQTVGNYPAGALARGFGWRGPNLTLACGAGSGFTSISEAINLILHDRAEVMAAGEVFALTPALDRMAKLNGNDTPSEGACVLILESVPHAEARNVRADVVLELIGNEPRDELQKFIDLVLRPEVRGLKLQSSVALQEWTARRGGILGSGVVAAGWGHLRGLSGLFGAFLEREIPEHSIPLKLTVHSSETGRDSTRTESILMTKRL